MRYSQAFIPTLKEVPKEATNPSHILLLRAGFVRMVGAGIYSPDTPVGSQSSSPALAAGGGLARCDTAESTETKTMGNGAGNHDETSENIATAFAPTSSPTPGAAPASGFCP